MATNEAYGAGQLRIGHVWPKGRMMDMEEGRRGRTRESCVTVAPSSFLRFTPTNQKALVAHSSSLAGFHLAFRFDGIQPSDQYLSMALLDQSSLGVGLDLLGLKEGQRHFHRKLSTSDHCGDHILLGHYRIISNLRDEVHSQIFHLARQ
jgi:hypothetical protein